MGLISNAILYEYFTWSLFLISQDRIRTLVSYISRLNLEFGDIFCTLLPEVVLVVISRDLPHKSSFHIFGVFSLLKNCYSKSNRHYVVQSLDQMKLLIISFSGNIFC